MYVCCELYINVLVLLQLSHRFVNLCVCVFVICGRRELLCHYLQTNHLTLQSQYGW